jgi:hypothetical protein
VTDIQFAAYAVIGWSAAYALGMALVAQWWLP